MQQIMTSLLTIAAASFVGAVCDALNDTLDPVGADARLDLTDANIAAFLDS